MMPTPDRGGPLTDQERQLVERLFSDPMSIPLEFWAALRSKMMTDEALTLGTTQVYGLDRKLRGAVPTPAGIGANEIVVWNGSAWVRGGLANVTVLGLTAANTDFGWVGGTSPITFYNINGAGAGTLRNIQTPAYAGQRLVIKNLAAAAVTMLHNSAGTGAILYNRTLANVVLLPNESIEYVFNGSLWDEINRDTASGPILTGIITSTGAITAGTGFTVAHPGVGQYDITYTVAYAAAPIVLVTPLTGPFIGVLNAASGTGGCTIFIENSTTGAVSNQAFNFIVVQTV